ncbi:MAG: class II fumarate hydratase [Acidimicrobiales bacterium]
MANDDSTTDLEGGSGNFRPLWGAETEKAIENFPVSGEPVPASVIRWLALIKAAAATTNAELGLLDGDRGRRIAAAAVEVADGMHDRQFPVDVFQTGSGTSTNMNVNEVVSTLAGPDVHPNDHVNLGQSSNDVFPSAVHLAVLEEVTGRLLPAMTVLEASLREKADEFAELPKAARTHLMDAVPMTLGQEFSGYATQIELGRDRLAAPLHRVAQIPLGGTAVGTGLNTHPRFASLVRRALGEATGLRALAPANPFEAQSCRDSLVEFSGATKTVAVSLTKIASDLILLSSGPRCGLGELHLPTLQKGSSIMPGKVNPVIPEVVCQVAAQVIGNDAAVTVAGSQGNLELNVRVPMMARNLLQSIGLLTSACSLLADRCVAGITADRDRLAASAESTLASATALNPVIGYDRTATLVLEAERTGRSLRDVAVAAGLDEHTMSRVLDPLRLAAGGLPDRPTG